MTMLFRHLATGADGDTKIAGTGLRVYTVPGLYEIGQSVEYTADAYDVPIAAVFEALAYAYDHPDEMETIRRVDEAAEEYSLGLLPEELRRYAKEMMRADEQEYQEAVRRAREERLGTLIP